MDQLPDDMELRFGSDPNKADTDGDGLRDDQEFMSVTDPTRPDTDEDGRSDSESDADEDGRLNAAEFTDGTNPLVADTDSDGLNDGREAATRTNPLVIDTDLDGSDDPDEITLGTDPLVADTDGDGILDGDGLVERSITFPETGASIQITGAAAAILDVALRDPVDTEFLSIVGLRAPPIDVVTKGPATGTLEIPFNTDGLSGDANLAVLHFDEATGTFDTPADAPTPSNRTNEHSPWPKLGATNQSMDNVLQAPWNPACRSVGQQ